MYWSICSLLTFLVIGSLAVPTTNGALGPKPYSPKVPPLDTPWTNNVSTNPWPEYPRPQLQRSKWQNLNGLWQYQRAESINAVYQPPFGQPLTHEVLVPSCLESALSGIQGKNTLYSWFRQQFKVPGTWSNQHVLLHFGAIDYEATVFINGKKVGFHRGGYFHFTLDIMAQVKFGGNNELLVFVHDPTDSDPHVIPIGKQTLNPSHIFYTPCSGIWQSVWIEPAPENFIMRLDLNANMRGQVNVTVHSVAGKGITPVSVAVHEDKTELTFHHGIADTAFQFEVGEVNLWSPNTPTLYNVTIKMGDDEITSYTGFRTISKGKVNGVLRPLLNGEFVFMIGTLDQGYWPDGLYTPPTRKAMVYDLEMLKDLGFNMLRKHIKIESSLFYRACDELGLMVIQDMPSPRPLQGILPNAAAQQEFSRQLELMVNQLRSHPSIVTWVLYNEGWGQIIDGYPEIALAARVKQLDPSRLISATSGWIDHGAGDFSDNHHYANPQCGTPFYSLQSSPHDPTRIGFQGEFGGIGHNVSIDNLWKNQKAINSINETYEIDQTLNAWNYRSHLLLTELLDQVRRFDCSGGVWTQTTDVEGEVNGLMTYDRRIKRVNRDQWKDDIQALYHAAEQRRGVFS